MNRVGRAFGVDMRQRMPKLSRMATVTVRSTYSLDLDAVRRLEGLAKRWNTSKSGALRRAIREASERASPAGSENVAALRQLQQMLALDADDVARWAGEVRRQRRGA